MDLSLLQIQCRYKYYQWLHIKYKLWQYWCGLNQKQKVSWILFGGTCISSLSWFIWQYWKKRDEELREKLINDLYDKRPLSIRRKRGYPPGLFNDGNTCFANSVLQALASSTCFVSWVTKVMAEGDVLDLTVFPSIYRLFLVLRNMSGNEDTYSVSDLFNSLRSHGWIISSEQQDAFEFCQVLKTTLDEEVEKLLSREDDFKYPLDYSPYSEKRTILHRVSKYLPDLLNKSFTSPLRGLLASKMTCTRCNFQYPVKFENFESLILSLDGVQPFNVTLDTCLKKWILPEIVNDVECAKCSKLHPGKKYCAFKKEMSIAKLPVCLCIQLQRTYYSPSGLMFKNPVHVKFEEHMYLTDYSYQHLTYKKRQHNNNKNDLKLLGGSASGHKNLFKRSSSSTFGCYKLMSVIVHYGQAEDGHYATYRRLPTDEEKWVYISDTLVKPVVKSEVFCSTAYLLFYERMK